MVTETMPGVRSVTFGIWVGVGSCDETQAEAGASHYLEHLLFKGTARRSALEISEAIDALGGEINAFTGKEYTCFYARVLDEDLAVAIDVVTDLVTSSQIQAADVESERGVILEEIAMHDDDPADAVHDEFAAAMYGNSPLGRPILGTVESIEGLSRDTIAGYYTGRYAPQDLVVSAAGNLDHDRVVELTRQALDRPGWLDGAAAPAAPRMTTPDPEPVADQDLGVTRLLRRPTEQANVVLGVPGLSRVDPRRYALGVLNAAFGGGMSSRLFQEVREKRGLAYSVYSYSSQYAGSGLLGVYAGCLPPKTDEVLRICRGELATVLAEGLTEPELVRAQGQLRGSLVLGLEDSASRMTRLGKAELLYDEWLSVEDVLGRIEAVTLDQVHAVTRELLGEPLTLAIVGPFEEDRDFSGALS